MFSFNSIWPNSAPLRDASLENLSDVDFDLSRLLKVNCHGAIRLSTYNFNLVFITNILYKFLYKIATSKFEWP